MGWSYLLFRIFYQLKLKSGIIRSSYPTNPKQLNYPTLESWRQSSDTFFDLSGITLNAQRAEQLKPEVNRIKQGEIPFFDKLWLDLGIDYDWVTNPQSGFRYDIKQHWTQVNDFSKEQGDIKYVWEKSRFLHLYRVIRYDRYSGEDQAVFVLSEIISWIDANPINCGPNYKCSQEIVIRILNWLYFLNYYREHAALTSDIYRKVMHALYWQMHHVYQNIDFSRKAVRNNHTLTEALGLCLVGTLLPGLPNASTWASKGQEWFEEALSYQVYSDGTYLQYSMNYHRVVIQLLTWAIILGEINKISWGDVVYDRAKKSLDFLISQIQSNGHLPNYGANDGAIFFPLSDSEFRDYRPHLDALNFALSGNRLFKCEQSKEMLCWLGGKELSLDLHQPTFSTFEFKQGGYYGFRDQESFTFIRCGSHPFRPSQADNLHLDLWSNGQNILRDAGSYQYNTENDLVRYFNGSASHNTVMVNGMDQMEKGPRFIWLNWSQAVDATMDETEEYWIFEGTIHAFKHLADRVYHRRKVIKYKNKLRWKIEDQIHHHQEFRMTQMWNPGPEFSQYFRITAHDQRGELIPLAQQEGWYSNSYGHKEKSSQLYFEAKTRKILTEIVHLDEPVQ